jgi:Flp pilus assembly protein TadD
MASMRVPRLVFISALFLLSFVSAQAEDKTLKLHFPKRNRPTPVQQYNRDGVTAIEKHDYDKAKKLFYRAYLLDPDDPFTLNNLGYIAELEGDVDRAQRYYDLAAEHKSEAVVDKSDNEAVQGKQVGQVAGNAEDQKLEINRLNVQALALLLKDRAPEADMLLQNALKVQPNNPFTLNNMGYAKEKEGEYESGLSYYTAAAKQNSRDLIVVAAEKGWRGRAISEVAQENADNLQKLMKKENTLGSRVARLNLQGVSALNRNDRDAARKAFEAAYKADPNDAFALNNMGYVAELDSDRETADYYYDKAREARRASGRVTVASRRDAEGRRLSEVADVSMNKVQSRMEADLEARRRQGGDVILRTRDNKPVIEPLEKPKPVQEAISVRDTQEVVQQPAQQQAGRSAQSGATGAIASPNAAQSQGQSPTVTKEVTPPAQQKPATPPWDIPTPDDNGPPK